MSTDSGHNVKATQDLPAGWLSHRVQDDLRKLRGAPRRMPLPEMRRQQEEGGVGRDTRTTNGDVTQAVASEAGVEGVILGALSPEPAR